MTTLDCHPEQSAKRGVEGSRAGRQASSCRRAGSFDSGLRPPLRMTTGALTVERLTVRADRLVCEVAVAPTAPRSTSPELLARVRAVHPHVPRHACVNDEGDTFAAVMDHTSLPHLLEHLVIDLQTQAAQAASDDHAVFVGTTEWVDELAGRARIEVSFTDDLVALRAFRDATAFLNAVVVP